MRIIATLFLLSLLPLSIKAKWETGDSLRIRELINGSKKTILVNPQEARANLSEAIRLSRSSQIIQGEVIALLELNTYHNLVNQHDSALFVGKSAIELANRHGYTRQECRGNIAVASTYLNFVFRADSSVKFLKRASELVAQLDNPLLASNIHSVWKIYYMELKDYQKAEEKLLLAIDKALEVPKASVYQFQLHDAVQFYGETNQPTKRLKYLEKYLQGRSPTSFLAQNYDFFHRSVMTAGYKLVNQNKEELLEKDLQLHKDLNNAYGIFFTSLHLINEYGKQGKVSKAEKILQETLEWPFEEKNFDWEFRRQREAFRFYERQGNATKAVFHLKKMEAAKDSMNSREAKLNALNLEAEYKSAEQEAELLKKDRLLKREKEEQNTVLITVVLLGLLLVASIGLLIRRIRNQRMLKEKNDQIQAALEDKEVLLKEIHHRVKNNLQVISSLLSLQSRQVDDPAIQRALLDSRNRVRSMALIHQDLYQENHLIGVDAQTYVKKLSQNLLTNYKIDEKKISIQTEIDPIKIDVDTIVPIGLIINELVSNSLKYAFVNRDLGIILIKLKTQADSMLLEVSDNGVGLAKNFAVEDSESLGFRLLHSFSQKLEANLEIDSSENGLRIRMTMPLRGVVKV